MSEYISIGSNDNINFKNFLIVAVLMLSNHIIVTIVCILFIMYYKTKNVHYVMYGGFGCLVIPFTLLLTYGIYLVIHKRRQQIDVHVDFVNMDTTENSPNDFFIEEEIQTV